MTIESRFTKFHADNPHVYREIVAAARRLRKHGHERYGIAGIVEFLRYSHNIQTRRDDGDYKLDNSFRAIYSRIIMQQEPDLKGFFSTRERKTEGQTWIATECAC